MGRFIAREERRYIKAAALNYRYKSYTLIMGTFQPLTVKNTYFFREIRSIFLKIKFS